MRCASLDLGPDTKKMIVYFKSNIHGNTRVRKRKNPQNKLIDNADKIINMKNLMQVAELSPVFSLPRISPVPSYTKFFFFIFSWKVSQKI
jgi:hypothetical protein